MIKLESSVDPLSPEQRAAVATGVALAQSVAEIRARAWADGFTVGRELARRGLSPAVPVSVTLEAPTVTVTPAPPASSRRYLVTHPNGSRTIIEREIG